jgi:hypothetical protein
MRVNGFDVLNLSLSKNWAHWLKTGSIKLQLLQSHHSHCDSLRRQRSSTIVGKFHEIRHFFFPKSNIRAGVISITPDLVNAEYPLVVVQRALYRMYEASGMSVWRKLCTDMPDALRLYACLSFYSPGTFPLLSGWAQVFLLER